MSFCKFFQIDRDELNVLPTTTSTRLFLIINNGNKVDNNDMCIGHIAEGNGKFPWRQQVLSPKSPGVAFRMPGMSRFLICWPVQLIRLYKVKPDNFLRKKITLWTYIHTLVSRSFETDCDKSLWVRTYNLSAKLRQRLQGIHFIT